MPDQMINLLIKGEWLVTIDIKWSALQHEYPNLRTAWKTASIYKYNITIYCNNLKTARITLHCLQILLYIYKYLKNIC